MVAETIDVSVVVPVFDDLPGLRRCLAALGDQITSRSFEIVVVDNGSAVDVARAIGTLPRVRVVAEPIPGSYRARNTGVAHAHGALLAFTDADCRPAPDWLERGADAVASLGGHAMVAGDVDVIVAGASTDDRPATTYPVAAYELATAFRQRYYVEKLRFGPTANLFVPRIEFQRLGGFDTTLRSSGDKEFGRRAVGSGLVLAFEPKARVGHPTRVDAASLEHKVRRVVGGDHVLARGRLHRTAADLLRYMLLRPAKASLQILMSDRLPWRDRLRALGVVPRVAAWQLDERVRLLRGEEPSR